MNQGLLCRWLSVDAKAWPPDPCTLLGLPQGSNDLAQIEKCVHERMARLRCYQLSHPEEATEGMNRLAQAFVCLSEAAARRQNSPSGQATPCQAAPCQPGPCQPANGTSRPKVSDDTAVGKKTVVNWQTAPPPVRRPGESGAFPAVAASDAGVSEPAVSTAPGDAAAPAVAPAAVSEPAAPSAPAAHAAPADDVTTAAPFIPPPCAPAPPGAEEAQELSQSAVARTGLATVEALIDRIYHTRRLLVAWERGGEFLGDPQRMADAAERDVSKRLRAIDRALERFPPVIGAPGKPGYRIAAMARLKMTASMLRGADELHRELLARDWEAGRRVLLAYRRFLHVQFKLMRRHGAMRLFGRAVRFFLNDHPALTATGAILVAGASLGLYWMLSP